MTQVSLALQSCKLSLRDMNLYDGNKKYESDTKRQLIFPLVSFHLLLDIFGAQEKRLRNRSSCLFRSAQTQQYRANGYTRSSS